MASIGPMVSEEMFENIDIHTHTRTIEAYLYYKLIHEPKDSGELKIRGDTSHRKPPENCNSIKIQALTDAKHQFCTWGMGEKWCKDLAPKGLNRFVVGSRTQV